jgi:putative transcriptional regulator
MSILNQTAKQIKELRFRLGMTQEQFAVKMGTTGTTVHRWENGHSHPSPMALKLMQQILTEISIT